MDDDVFQWLRGVASGSWASPMLITTNGIARRHEQAGHAERLFAHSTARTMCRTTGIPLPASYLR